MKTARAETKKAPTRTQLLKSRSKSKEKSFTNITNVAGVNSELSTLRLNLSKAMAESNSSLGKELSEGRSIVKSTVDKTAI